jgi:Protein of unknown function (DUF4229)
MTPGLKYALGRLGIFVVCAVPAVTLLPKDLNLFLRLMIALIVSAALSFALLRRWRDEVAEQMSTNSRRRIQQKEKLRSALAGDDEAGPADAG